MDLLIGDIIDIVKEFPKVVEFLKLKEKNFIIKDNED
jgi:hypothetical protein